MLTVALILISAGVLIHLGVGVYSVAQTIKARRNYENMVEGFRAFITPDGPETISDFNKTIYEIASIFADRYRTALTAAERGAQGAAARDINRGLEEVAIAQNPALAVAGALPKSLQKNPLAAAGLNMIIQNIMSKQTMPGPGSGSNGSNSQAKFDL